MSFQPKAQQFRNKSAVPIGSFFRADIIEAVFMNALPQPDIRRPPADSGLTALVGVAAYFRIPADASHLARELAVGDRTASAEDVVRGARVLGLKARIIRDSSPKRLAALP